MSEMTTPAERARMGREARRAVPRSSHAGWTPPADRRDIVGTLLAQAETRVPELVPVRHERMLVSPFTFYRGAAAIMAADLASTPATGIRVQCCGDAHLANFGGFQSPERLMVFDINDFDETTPGPWEWDVKRLAASFVIAARDLALDDADAATAVLSAVRAYREAMRSFAAMGALDVWYARLDAERVIAQWGSAAPKGATKRLQRTIAKAESKNRLKAFAKLTERVDGEVRFVSDPPLLVRAADLFADSGLDDFDEQMRQWLLSYSKTLQHERRRLLEQYRVVDFARKVVGVGSVGTRCWVALLIGRDESDPLFLQVKQAEQSVLEPFVGKSGYAENGQRVVEGQLLVQAASDIFLGWNRATGPDGLPRDFYVRQLWDGKLSPDLTTFDASRLRVYAEMCGWTLARAHARSGDRFAIAGYLGASDVFDRAIVEFANAYAAQNERDHATARAAADEGRLPVSGGSPRDAVAAAP